MLRPVLLGLMPILLAAQTPRLHRLTSTPDTVVFGYYAASAKPVLRIQSGDRVEITTSMIASPQMLEEAGVSPEAIKPSLRAIHSRVTDRGPGPHILTGPIYVEGAEPSDVLEVQIESIRLALPYALNIFVPGKGVLPDDYPYKRVKIFPLDEDKMVARFAEGIEIPLRPFFGSMGVAPPSELGRISSAPPWVHAGNLDNKELVAGTTLFIPVHAPGALFFVGDAHAAQGDGEVDVTALETALTGTFRFQVHKGRRLRWPRAETPTHFMTMGFHEDLEAAVQIALREMIDFLVTDKGLDRDDAYMLASTAVDLNITQLVDGKKGIHASVPKAIFVAPNR